MLKGSYNITPGLESADMRTQRKWLYICAAVLILIMGIGIWQEFYYVLLLPFILAVFWAAFFKLEWLWYFIVFFTPLSINLEEMKLGGIGMALPTEPLLFGILILFFFKLLSGNSIDKRIFHHPISYVIYAYLAWMVLTCITSEIPIVSIKYVLTRMWFIASFYFIATHLFKDEKNMQRYLLCYFFPLCAVIIYTVIRHSQYGFDKTSGHWVMEPLFKDHTSYGAVLAMYFPVVIGLLMRKHMNLLLRVLLTIGFVILTVGIILSYTRAAWLSIAGIMGILVVMLLRIRLRTALLALLVSGTFVYLSWDDLQVALSRNKQDSSDKLEEHVTSMSNVSSDASNLERLNRWNCAIEMFKERPMVGWGPGTYQFVYAPFQRSKDLTIISTRQGNGGNAHSEYLGPLCEQGVLGMALFIALLLGVSQLAFRLFYHLRERNLKLLVGSTYLGLMTYYIHGVLNNYLDLDKASIPFWGFTAILVAIDLYHKKKGEPTEKVKPQA
ncbi:MAG TPA: O-antigen ligase family protein [Flavobacteriales bacterium]